MQLIEVALVSAFRNAGISLKRITGAREYLANRLLSEHPFAEYRFKTDGKSLFMDYQQVEGKKGKGTLLRPDCDGQLAWDEIIGQLNEFE